MHTLLALLLTTLAQAGALAEHAGTYLAAPANAPFCPQQTTLTLSVEEGEQSFRVAYAGPGTVNGVRIEGERSYALGRVEEVRSLPLNHYERLALLGGRVLRQERSKFGFSWSDKEVLFSFAEPGRITAYFTTVPCSFVQL